jgi:outer membrane protein TolC
LYLILFAFLTESAYPQQVMTLERCRELALENNKTIAMAAQKSEIAGWTQKSYRTNFLPKISASGAYFFTNTKMHKTIEGAYLPTFVPDPATGQLAPNILTMGPDGAPIFREYAYFPDMDISLKLSGTWMAGIKAEQPLYTGGKITSAYKMSQIGSELATLNQALTRAEIILKTDEAYWTYVQTTELAKLALSFQQVVTELLRNVQDAQEVGLKHRNDVLKVQVKVNEAELKVRQAENGRLLSRKNLCRLTGLPFDSEIVLPPSFETSTPLNNTRLADYATRPEYAMLTRQIALKDQQVKLVQSDFLPKAGLMANYGYLSGLVLNGDKLLDRASFFAIASVNIPLFQWGEGRHKIRAAKAERDLLQLQRDDVNEQMALELAQALDKCDESSLEVRLTARALEQAAENMKISGDQYAEGMETLADYLEAQTVWQRAWTEHINAQTRQRLNQTHYLKSAGQLGN